MEEYFIGEGSFVADMKAKAEPYLAGCAQTVTLERESGHPIHAVRYTPQGRPARGVIVISHGFIESVDKYRELIYYFLREGYAVSIHDHCGHGSSYRLTKDPCKVHIDTYDRYVDDLLYAAHAAADAWPGLPLYLFAHSMGGGVGAAAAAKEPELFTKVVLSSPMIRPATAGIPWPLVRFLCWFFCSIGRSESYVISHGPYKGPDKFSESASVSRERFDYYQERRCSDPLLQTNGASYSWLYGAVHLNDQLQGSAWQKITAPVLLLQADDDTFVINDQQNLFIEKLSARSKAQLVHIDNSRHEIFNSHDPEVRSFLAQVLNFLIEE